MSDLQIWNVFQWIDIVIHKAIPTIINKFSHLEPPFPFFLEYALAPKNAATNAEIATK